MRTALLVVGLAFCALFAAMTITVAVEDGVSILTIASGAILLLLVPPLLGALLNPPDD